MAAVTNASLEAGAHFTYRDERRHSAGIDVRRLLAGFSMIFDNMTIL